MVAASDKGKYFIYVIFSVASLGGLSFGYHFGVISGAMIQIKKEIEINDTWHVRQLKFINYISLPSVYFFSN